MKCPRCEGVGEVQEGTGYPNGEGGEEYRIFDCPHCDGTGEIKNGDVWRCGYIDSANSKVIIFLKCTGTGWVYYDLGHECFMRSLPREHITPIARMKEVE